jgi:putative ABC transport system permease protein
MRLSTTVEEAFRSALAQRVSSGLVALLCAAICVVTLLTVGRTATAEEQVLSRLDSAGSRLLVVSDDQGSGLVTPTVVRVLASLDTVERVVGVDSPFDVVNAAIGDGAQRVPTWRISGELHQAVELTAGRWPQPGEALVSRDATTRLGMVHPAGAVRDSDGDQYDVVGSFVAREPFGSFDAGVIVASDDTAAVRSVHVVVTGVEAARITEAATLATLAPPDPSGVTVQSPTALAELQQAVGGDLGEFGRGLLLLTLGGGAFLIAVVVLAEVLLRRRDLGRRRALGAPRWGLVTLVVARTVAAAVPGALLGAVVGYAVAAGWGQPPPVDFTAAVAVLSVLVAGAVAVAPALLAAGRDPVGVLRTP